MPIKDRLTMPGEDQQRGDGVHLPAPRPRSALPRIEFGRSKRGDVVYYGALISAAVASWLVRLLPNWLARRIALFLSDRSFNRSKGFRQNVCSNLSHIFDCSPDDPLVVRNAREIFRANGLNALDLLRVPHMDRGDFERQVTLAGGSWKTIDDALESGKGVILITGHLGPFDLTGSAIKVRGYPMSALTVRTTNRFAFHFVKFLRSSQEMSVIETSSGGLRSIVRCLNQGEMIVLLSDRDFFLSGRETMFFEEPTTLPMGAVRLARDTGAAIIPFFSYRRGGKNELVIREPVLIARTSDKEADLERGLAIVARELERAISLAPEQWVLFQRVWPDDFEPGAAAAD